MRPHSAVHFHFLFLCAALLFPVLLTWSPLLDPAVLVPPEGVVSPTTTKKLLLFPPLLTSYLAKNGFQQCGSFDPLFKKALQCFFKDFLSKANEFFIKGEMVCWLGSVHLRKTNGLFYYLKSITVECVDL